MKLVFVHGWGFTPEFWKPMQQHLSSYDCIDVDLGYFNTAPTPHETLPENALYIGHSLGVLWLLKHHPEKMAALVSISGFDCFHQYISERILNRMKYGLKTRPQLQLASFYKQCGLHKSTEFSPLHLDRLMNGLEDLSSLDCSAQKKNLSIPIFVLASHDDPIVPDTMTSDIWQNHEIHWSETGKHILPLEKPQWCASLILNLCDQLEAQC